METTDVMAAQTAWQQAQTMKIEAEIEEKSIDNIDINKNNMINIIKILNSRLASVENALEELKNYIKK